MQAYIARRVLLFIPTLIFVTIVVFVIMRVVPGDPAQLMAMAGGESSDVSEERVAELRTQLGTDKPIHVQYVKWVWNLLHLDFGRSYWFNSKIYDDLGERLPVTMELTVLAVLWANLVAIPLGVLSAIKQDTPADYASRIIALLGIALPNFWVGVMIVFFLVLFFNWIPPLGYEDLWENPVKNLQQLMFPALALGFSNMAFVARVTRSSVLEVFREDYIRTARSKGLAERAVISRHALKNALLPVITVTGYEFGRLLAGTVIIEVIFVVPGMGVFLVDAISRRDFPVVQAVVTIVAVLVLVLNLVMDLIYAWLNPRISYA